MTKQEPCAAEANLMAIANNEITIGETIPVHDAELACTWAAKEIQHLRKQQQWINCNDRLPETDTTVLLCAPGEDEPVWLGYLVDEDDEGPVWSYVDGSPHELVTVTHDRGLLRGGAGGRPAR